MRRATIAIISIAGGLVCVGLFWAKTFGDGHNVDFGRMVGNFLIGALVGGAVTMLITNRTSS